MSHLYKTNIWQSGSGQWYVNDTSDLSGVAGLWWIPARILGIEPAAYIEWLVKTYKPDRISFDKILLFSWDASHYNLANSYKLYINKIARQKKFMV